jgi:FtsH-binding integral membrane protein
MAFAASRPIEGAVATLGVSDRVTFLRKTYAHLGVALIAFAAITGGMMVFMSHTSLHFSAWALKGRWTWLAVLAMFMVVGWIAERLARSQTSTALQYLGLGIAVVGEAILLQPMLWLLMLKFGGPDALAQIGAIWEGEAAHLPMTGLAAKILLEAVVITLAIFIGLTAVVFITKKDFSFMRGILAICSFAAIGVILASLMFGFHLGAIFSGLMILLMAGYILFQTSIMMKEFPPTAFVAAALMLFSTIATLFWYVLRLLMELSSNR